jgi:predicted Zn finger-like uncharacterized protein
MRSITNCPACQTQFVVTDEQLNQHGGKVRCGKCLNVFDATQQIVESDENDLENADDSNSYDLVVDQPQSEKPKLDETEPAIIISEEMASEEQVIEEKDTKSTNADTRHTLTAIADAQPSNFDDLADKSKLNPSKITKRSRLWILALLAFMLLLFAVAQSVYFLRNEIAIYYPRLKPYLVQACEKIACSIDLPKKIEFIVIDDSDIQEDADYLGLMRLSSTLINQAGFSQAYPNIELTLTDTEDKPKLRRFFKPSEYLAANTNIANGLGPGEEVKIKLAMTTHGETVAGYRVFVTY